MKEASDARNNVAKDVSTAFHVGLGQFRAASWAKLPPLWHIAVKTSGRNTDKYSMNSSLYVENLNGVHLKGVYDYVWYIDSDATVSPFRTNRSIDDAIDEWVGSGVVTRGSSNIRNSSFIFFNNHPWRDNMPCAGSFIFQPKLAEPILREWWDYDLPVKNFKHFHEQDALWHMIESEGDAHYAFKMNSKSYSIVTERQT